jgi:hypothetical protein
MTDTLSYMHFGDSLKQSLKNYGMICLNEKGDQYHFIYKIQDKYEEGFIRETDITELLDGESGFSTKEINDFLLESAKLSMKEFKELPILHQVYKLSEHFGVETILGKSIAPFSLETALDLIKEI